MIKVVITGWVSSVAFPCYSKLLNMSSMFSFQLKFSFDPLIDEGSHPYFRLPLIAWTNSSNFVISSHNSLKVCFAPQYVPRVVVEPFSLLFARLPLYQCKDPSTRVTTYCQYLKSTRFTPVREFERMKLSCDTFISLHKR